MLILQPNDVKYCELAGIELKGGNLFTGIVYQKNFFYRVSQYGENYRSEALKEARELMNNSQNKSSILIVAEDKSFTIWREGNHLLPKFPESNSSLRYSFNLSQLKDRPENMHQEMHRFQGLIKDRRVGIRKYRKCFTGKQALAWLVGRYNISKEEAREVFQSLIINRSLYAIDYNPTFKDDHSLYRFYTDEVY